MNSIQTTSSWRSHFTSESHQWQISDFLSQSLKKLTPKKNHKWNNTLFLFGSKWPPTNKSKITSQSIRSKEYRSSSKENKKSFTEKKSRHVKVKSEIEKLRCLPLEKKIDHLIWQSPIKTWFSPNNKWSFTNLNLNSLDKFLSYKTTIPSTSKSMTKPHKIKNKKSVIKYVPSFSI